MLAAGSTPTAVGTGIRIIRGVGHHSITVAGSATHGGVGAGIPAGTGAVVEQGVVDEIVTVVPGGAPGGIGVPGHDPQSAAKAVGRRVDGLKIPRHVFYRHRIVLS